MGNTNESELTALQRFKFHEQRTILLINGYCRTILSQEHDYEQFNFNVITFIIIKHYQYTINSSLQSLSKYLPLSIADDDYYLSVSFEIAQMLIESHHSIRKHFKGATKRNGLRSNKDKSDKYYEDKLDKYLFSKCKLKQLNISRMDFVGKTRRISKSQPICPAKTIDDYKFEITGDPTLIYNGTYIRCYSLADTTINDRGEVPFVTAKKYNKLEFDKKRLNIWINENDMIEQKISDNNIEQKIPNKRLKYIRCLIRDNYNNTHCYWRLHCLKLNHFGEIPADLQSKQIGSERLDEDSDECIQYLGVVHRWRQRNGAASSKEILPQYYEYPCGRHTVWRKVEGVSFVSAHMALCQNEFCSTLPQLSNLGTNSNTIKCQLLNTQAKIVWNDKFLKNVEKNINYADHKSEAKLIFYLTFIWLNELIYKVALDHGFNFKKINKAYLAPHFYYKQNWNPLAKHLQKYLLKGRIKYYGKDIYFKKVQSSLLSASDTTDGNRGINDVKIADNDCIIEIVDKLLNCLRTKLQNKSKHNTEWMNKLNHIELAPEFKSNKTKLIQKIRR